MKLQYAAFALIVSCVNSHAERLTLPFLASESQSNIIVIANDDHPIPCPLEYTNLLSNTNLFSMADQEQLKKITLKYQNVSTNKGPAGSVFNELGLRRMKQHAGLRVPTNTFWVACFTYTNSDAQEEIKSEFPGDISTTFRSKTGDGYDAVFANNSLFAYQEYKHGVLDGLFIIGHDPNNPNDKEHCGMWARFTDGKIRGKLIMWEYNNFTDRQSGFKIMAEAEFKEPFDFLKYQSITLDLAWETVPAAQTNSVPNSP